MRKALLVIVLIAASFAGGAVVNGPGLRWAQSCVIQRLGLGAESTTEVVSGDELTINGEAPAAEGIPSRPIAPLVLDVPGEARKEPAADKASARNDSAVAHESSPASTPGKDPLEPLPPMEIPAPTTPLPSPEVVTAPELAPAPTPLPIPVNPPVTHAEADPKAVPERDGPLRKASLSGAVPNEDSASSGPDSTSTAAPIPSDWAAVRRAMKSLGVSRYGIEGDPNGRVRFHCVIPLAGRRAVGQHFEAEGDDDLQAARAALRRVALWRATEAEATPSTRTP